MGASPSFLLAVHDERGPCEPLTLPLQQAGTNLPTAFYEMGTPEAPGLRKGVSSQRKSPTPSQPLSRSWGGGTPQGRSLPSEPSAGGSRQNFPITRGPTHRSPRRHAVPRLRLHGRVQHAGPWTGDGRESLRARPATPGLLHPSSAPALAPEPAVCRGAGKRAGPPFSGRTPLPKDRHPRPALCSALTWG